LEEAMMNNQMNQQANINPYQWPYDSTSIVPGSGGIVARAYLAPNCMKIKLEKIAELFEMDVLSDTEALEACKKVIHQHSRAVTSAETIK
jgi:hypothetical protein